MGSIPGIHLIWAYCTTKDYPAIFLEDSCQQKIKKIEDPYLEATCVKVSNGI